MITTFFITIILLDFVLFYCLYFIYKKKGASSEILTEVTEERHQVKKLSQEVQMELYESQKKHRRIINEMKQLASEVQNELSISKESLEERVNTIYDNLSRELSSPMEEIVTKQNALQHLLKKTEKEKENLVRVIDKATRIISFFNDQVPYEKIIEDIENKKYSDTRRLLVQGVTPKKVAEQVGLSLSEVELIKNLAS